MHIMYTWITTTTERRRVSDGKGRDGRRRRKRRRTCCRNHIKSTSFYIVYSSPTRPDSPTTTHTIRSIRSTGITSGDREHSTVLESIEGDTVNVTVQLRILIPIEGDYR
jgi:hypothetical protein